VSRKLSGEATTGELAELSDLIKTQANTDLYLQAIEEFWKIPPEKDEDFLEATYHLHLNRLKEKGFDLEKDKEQDEPQALYFDDEDRPGKLNRKKSVIALSVLSAIILAFIFYQENQSLSKYFFLGFGLILVAVFLQMLTLIRNNRKLPVNPL